MSRAAWRWRSAGPSTSRRRPRPPGARLSGRCSTRTGWALTSPWAQKGASAREVILLDRVLSHFADVFGTLTGQDLRDVPGAGCAGGLGFGLAALMVGLSRQHGGTSGPVVVPIVPGFALVAALTHLEERLARAELVITGEGSLDAQSPQGKGPWELARRARALGKTVVCIAGRITAPGAKALFDVRVESSPEEVPATAPTAPAARAPPPTATPNHRSPSSPPPRARTSPRRSPAGSHETPSAGTSEAARPPETTASPTPA